ncbi:MAG: hypothetical protein BWX72_02058 [Firmicutes bacterium ADurb.Bin080]|nr:MAG: hypothetical protein BWX72_02058 [Firmicutes bacterium ADurb.Bin080]
MYIKRILEERILELSNDYPVVCVVGARQVGKSTMINHILPPNFHACSLDSKLDISLCKQDPKGYIMSKGLPLFIDEAQNVPELFSEIKAIVDNKKILGENVNGLFWLSGSNKSEIKKHIKESLAGRIAIVEMSSLSKEEIEGNNNGVFNPFYENIESRVLSNINQVSLFEYIFKGGYPKFFENEKIDRDVYYSSYIDTYIERDVRQLISENSLPQFTMLITYLSARIAEIINFEDAARTIGVNEKTVKNWVQILKETGIIFFLQPYSNNISRRLVKSPKIYFLDSGLAAFLARWLNPEQLRIGAASGHFLENYVVSEIVKSHYNNLKRLDLLFYYRDFDQKETDIIFADNTRIIPVEIKKGMSPNIPSIYHLEKFKLDIPNKYILYGDKETFSLTSGWVYLPLAKI